MIAGLLIRDLLQDRRKIHAASMLYHIQNVIQRMLLRVGVETAKEITSFSLMVAINRRISPHC